MSKVHHAIYLTLIGGLAILIVGLLLPRSVDHSEQVNTHHVVVFPFRSSNVDSEDIAADLTLALIRSLEKVPTIEVVAVSDLPRNMRDPSNHHLWSNDGVVSLFVEGNVQRSAAGVRITAQLVDASSNNHVWSNSFVADHDINSEVVEAVEDQVVHFARK